MKPASEITFAPREVYDLVFGCCRVRQLDVGTASTIANNVMWSELMWDRPTPGGSGLEMFARSQPELAGDARRQSPFVLGPQAWVAGEVRARKVGSTLVEFEMPVPLAAISAEVRNSWQRGVTCPEISDHVDDMDAASTFTELTLHFTPDGSESDRSESDFSAAFGQRVAKGFSGGLRCNPAVSDELKSLASEILVSETAVDEAVSAAIRATKPDS